MSKVETNIGQSLEEAAEVFLNNVTDEFKLSGIDEMRANEKAKSELSRMVQDYIDYNVTGNDSFEFANSIKESYQYKRLIRQCLDDNDSKVLEDKSLMEILELLTGYS